ncbi:hypothetical protein FQR65_LT20081 [Abscondita terminalis]|nr:hypothetical protein FQR65_LT20081 [Abscondita terminalis]
MVMRYVINWCIDQNTTRRYLVMGPAHHRDLRGHIGDPAPGHRTRHQTPCRRDRCLPTDSPPCSRYTTPSRTNCPLEGRTAGWYHAYFTGLVLFTVSRLGTAKAEAFVHEIFCPSAPAALCARPAHAGLDRLPMRLWRACCRYQERYQYHSCGVRSHARVSTEVIRSCRPTRGIWAGTALWLVSLRGVPRHAHRLAIAKRSDLSPARASALRSPRGAPDFNRGQSPTLPTDTGLPPTGQAPRNYAWNTCVRPIPCALQLWGPDQAGHHLGMAGGSRHCSSIHETARGLSGDYGSDAAGFAVFLRDLARAQGDHDTLRIQDTQQVIQQGWAFMQDMPVFHECFAAAWNGAAEGALQAHNAAPAAGLSAWLHTDAIRSNGP